MICHVQNRSPCACVAPLVAEFTDGTDHVTPCAKRVQAKLGPAGMGVATGWGQDLFWHQSLGGHWNEGCEYQVPLRVLLVL